MSDARLSRVDRALALALFTATVVVVGCTAPQIGFTRDEGYYFRAGESYWGWFAELGASWARGDVVRPFTRAVIDRSWTYNHEHPALMKSLFALSWGIGKGAVGLFDLDSSAFRFPAWCMAGLSVALTFILARSLLSRRAALLAALMWLSCPHVFWHMHLACFDVPVCAAQLWLVLAWHRGRRTGWGCVVIGVAFALAAAVKHNALIVPGVFVIHWLLFEQRGVTREPSGLRLPPVPLAFVAMATLGPLVYFAHWPWLWPDPLPRLAGYAAFHLNHEHYPILWFHELLTRPPFPISFPFVMSAVTVPVPVLTLFVLGSALAVVISGDALYRRLRRRAPLELTRVPLGDPAREPSASVAALLFGNALFPFVLIALPSTPIFGGTKHWMNGLPFLCILGAWALEEGFARTAAWRTAAAAPPTGRAPAVLAALLGAAIVVPGVWITARVHPYGLGSYNELVGFCRGAANAGFQRTFWGYEPRAALPLINAQTPARGRIHFGDTNQDSWRMYQRDGLLRDDIGWSGTVRGASVASVQPQGEFKQQWLDVRNQWGARQPAEVIHCEGVPLLTVTFAP